MRCPHCHDDLTAEQIGADLVRGGRDLCPVCRTDLTDPLRLHILECKAIIAAPGEQVEASRLLRKESDERITRSAVLAAESHALAERILLRRGRPTS